ncbi:hypothetical protein BHE74_00052490 [Ensete ventricosum]|nr:hypothetical protein BHE74_00052490 [Ensete ventricosum]RZS20236.1 hypothetical protein BHM03_00052735 [Ensete ventricosum]
MLLRKNTRKKTRKWRTEEEKHDMRDGKLYHFEGRESPVRRRSSAILPEKRHEHQQEQKQSRAEGRGHLGTPDDH